MPLFRLENRGKPIRPEITDERWRSLCGDLVVFCLHFFLNFDIKTLNIYKIRVLDAFPGKLIFSANLVASTFNASRVPTPPGKLEKSLIFACHFPGLVKCLNLKERAKNLGKVGNFIFSGHSHYYCVLKKYLTLNR